MELRWNQPNSDGGSAITDYVVERREVGKKSWKQVGTSSLCVIEIRGLKKNSAYNFRVFAKNSVGLSDAFIIEETFTTTKSVPKSTPGSPNVQVISLIFSHLESVETMRLKGRLLSSVLYSVHLFSPSVYFFCAGD